MTVDLFMDSETRNERPFNTTYQKSDYNFGILSWFQSPPLISFLSLFILLLPQQFFSFDLGSRTDPLGTYLKVKFDQHDLSPDWFCSFFMEKQNIEGRNFFF